MIHRGRAQGASPPPYSWCLISSENYLGSIYDVGHLQKTKSYNFIGLAPQIILNSRSTLHCCSTATLTL